MCIALHCIAKRSLASGRRCIEDPHATDSIEWCYCKERAIRRWNIVRYTDTRIQRREDEIIPSAQGTFPQTA